MSLPSDAWGINATWLGAIVARLCSITSMCKLSRSECRRANANRFEFPRTQSEIGDATGLSTVHVNRSMMELRRDGLITLERGRCTIPDLERFEEAAMFDPTYLHLRKGEGPSRAAYAAGADGEEFSFRRERRP